MLAQPLEQGVGDAVRPLPGGDCIFDNELVDEMTLFTFPVVVGQGTRLFAASGRDAGLALVDSRATRSGVTIQVYRPSGRPQYPTSAPTAAS